VVVIHERFADYVGDILKVPSGRVEIIRNWAHISDTRAPTDVVSARQLLGWHSTDTIVLHAGSMGAKQGLETIVEAARVADQEQAPVRFILLGDGSERTELMKSARGVSRVQFVDPLDDERYLIALQAADVLLVNSMRGVAEMAVPSKLTSYFSAGRPVVAAVDPSGIAASEIRSANAGVVVPAGEPVELFNAALELRADVERAAALGSNGRQYRERALGQDAALEAWAQLVEKIGRSSAY
jgi:glycosyltransferase involved in cell wall biosynthesis